VDVGVGAGQSPGREWRRCFVSFRAWSEKVGNVLYVGRRSSSVVV
jgi:hypothetical protein